MASERRPAGFRPLRRSIPRTSSRATMYDRGIPCPSAHDRGRNTHRSGAAWVDATVKAILHNPRYTGHEVWNKQRKDEVLIDVDDVALGHETRMRWNAKHQWIFSAQPSH